MQFQQLVGHQQLKQQFIQVAKSGRIHHTQLIISKPGDGALSLITAYAQYLQCENPTDTDSCGSCNQCKKVATYKHPDIHYTIPTITIKDQKRPPISDDWMHEYRNFIIEQPYGTLEQWLTYINAKTKQPNITKLECLEIIKRAKYKPIEGNFNINIIWRAELLSKEGNRLLKILEEPTDQTIFFLIIEDEEKILNTILSRSQIHRLNRIHQSDIEKYLVEQKDVDAELARRTAHLSDGNVALAINQIQSTEIIKEHTLGKLFKLIFQQKQNLVPFTEDLARLNTTEIKNLFTQGILLARESLILQETDMGSQLTQQDKAFANWLAKQLNFNQIHDLIDLFEKSSYAIERNANVRLLLLSVALKIEDLFLQRELANN